MQPEQKARANIDRLLGAAGWEVQDYKQLNLGAALGVAVREFPLKEGFADYLLFVDRKAAGVIEAKAEGETLSEVELQSEGYSQNLHPHIPFWHSPLPLLYESTGTETFFRDIRDPDFNSRRVFAFHRPEILREWAQQSDTLRCRLKQMPDLKTDGLRDCQIEAIQNLEKSFAQSKPRALIQMATGAGKTFTAVSFVYRLIKFANAKRVLFLVDRNTLGKQTKTEFQQYITPDDGRKFTELYNIQHLTSNALDPVSKVCITTIQRLYSMLRGEAEFDPELEEQSSFDVPLVGKPKEISYNPRIPIETFDFIVTDECHRSIYNLWRQVLEYFDAFIIGLTATPSMQTFGFFNQNLVMEYSHERAVADGVNVGYDVYRIKTHITEHGSKVEAGYYVDKRDRLTRKVRWEQLEDDLEYASTDLDRDVVATDQIRMVLTAFKDNLFTEIFPSRKEVPKTLIFAKHDSHAEDIVRIAREVFGKGVEFCKKITYRTFPEKPDDLIASFRNSYMPRIAITVDMISTGTDIKPLECLIFMRDVKSRGYFEQMKGRGTRVISTTDFKGVSPDGDAKTHFVIVDAVGVCESDKTDSRPLERMKSVSFESLVISVAVGNRDNDNLSSLAGRLARLDIKVSEEDKKKIEEASGGSSLQNIANALLDVGDPDKRAVKAKEMFGTQKPSEEQIGQAATELANIACKPFDNPDFRDILLEIKRRSEQTIDTVSQDTVLFTGFDEQAKEKALEMTQSFKKFIEENKDQITALQIIFHQPYAKRHLTREQLKDLAQAIGKPPFELAPERLWHAYEHLDKARVRGAGTQKLLTNIVSLVRFAAGLSDVLEPFSDFVEKKFEAWLKQQENAGRTFTAAQMEWLKMIKNHIATSLAIEMDDFELAPFHDKGGAAKVYQLFGSQLNPILDELNEVLVA